MPSLDQQRALLAHKHVSEVKKWPDEKLRKKYGGMVHRLPALVRSAGLSQALHFVSSRKSDDQKRVLDHLAAQLGHCWQCCSIASHAVVSRSPSRYPEMFVRMSLQLAAVRDAASIVSGGSSFGRW